MKVISEKDSPDPETLVYGMTVINKTLRGIPDSVSGASHWNIPGIDRLEFHFYGRVVLGRVCVTFSSVFFLEEM